MKKTNYVSPEMEILDVNFEGHLLQMTISEDPTPHGELDESRSYQKDDFDEE